MKQGNEAALLVQENEGIISRYQEEIGRSLKENCLVI